MKHLFRISVFVGVSLFLIACGRVSQAMPISVPSPSATSVPTITLSPSPAATFTPEPIPTQAYPTLIPTIDPTLVPGLLSQAFSIETTAGPNGHTIQKIAGWGFGFGNVMYPYYCPGHSWLDPSHLLLYPVAGQEPGGGGWGRYNLVPQPVVINLETGAAWLPPVQPENYGTCHEIYSSPELGILIHREKQGDTSFTSTYTYDGHKLASYPGTLMDVSPSGTKILLDENTLIDLRTNKRFTLDWSLEDYYEPHLSSLYWSYPDETRVYRCCYFYADLNTGLSHRFKRSDFQDAHGTHLDDSGLWFHQGEWVRNNSFFLVHWLAVDDGPVRSLPMFDPNTKLFYDVWKMAGISPDLTWRYNKVSPDGNYVWIVGFEGSYLVDLATFETQPYPNQDPYTYTDIHWSANSKFVWFQTQASDDEPTEFQIVSIADKKSSHLPVTPLEESDHWWHPTDTVVVYPSADKKTLVFLDASTMSYRELPFTLQKYPGSYGNVVWNPNGKKLALVKEDGSLWQVDYPTLENLEQLTPSLPDVQALDWSPDGNFLAFISGSDIYIVDTTK